MGALAAARLNFAHPRGFLLQRISTAAEDVVRMEAKPSLCRCYVRLRHPPLGSAMAPDPPQKEGYRCDTRKDADALSDALNEHVGYRRYEVVEADRHNAHRRSKRDGAAFAIVS